MFRFRSEINEKRTQNMREKILFYCKINTRVQTAVTIIYSETLVKHGL